MSLSDRQWSEKRVARAKPLPGDVGVSPTTKFPLLLARRRYEIRRGPSDEIDLRKVGIALIAALWTCETGQEKGQGDEVDQVVDLTPIVWKAPLDRRLRSRMATPPFQFTGMDQRNTPNSEQLR